MTFDYHEYSLNQLKNWINDAMTAGEATPQEIYDTIKKVVEENYYTYKDQTSRAYELLALLNGNGKGHIEYLDKDLYDSVIQEREYYEPSMPPWGHSDLEYLSHYGDKDILSCDKDDSTPECKQSWEDFWDDSSSYENVNQFGVLKGGNSDDIITFGKPKPDKVSKWVLPIQVDGLTGECYINLPDDLLEEVGWCEGTQVEWVEKNGCFELRKVNVK
jgi:hypothetical protein